MALSSLTTGAGRERLLNVNWLDFDSAEVFDAVAGDGAINMLPPDLHVRFIERIAAALRPGGRALMRVHVVGPPLYPDPKAVVEAYRRLSNPGSFWTWTRTHFDMLWRDADNAVRFDTYHELIQALFDTGILRREEHAAYESVASVNAITLYYAQREVFEAQVSVRFEIESFRCADDYESSDLHPLYVLIKR
jgi:SAM-dependent methyltransferase